MFRNNRLGVVALGLSILALMVAFSARFDGPGRWSREERWEERRGPVAAPQAPEAPRAPDGPPWARRGEREWHGPPLGWHGASGPEHRGWSMFGPLVVLSHLGRLATALLLIGLGLHLLRRSRQDRGGPPSDRSFSA